MKKRILASTMASVMALSAAGTSLISSAAVADYKQEAITKAELKNFLADKEIVDLAEDGGVDNYGSISGENFMTAYQYALSVVDDDEATAADCTTAFQMIKAAKAQLHQYDAKQLAALVEECKSIYNTENLLNPNSDSDDAIYDAETWADFAGAYEDAEGYTNYTGDIRITTDAYEELVDKRDKLDKLTIKTKREIDAARQAYEKALDLEFKYQPWQRGTIKASGDYNNREASWGAIYAHIASGEAGVKARYDEFAAIKGLTRTSNPNIVAAVDAMNLAASVLNGFTPVAMESGNQRKVTTLISNYQGRLVYTYNSDLAEEVFDSFVSVATTDPTVLKSNVWKDATLATNKADKWDYEESEPKQYKALNVNSGVKVSKVLSAEMTVRSNEANIWYVVDTGVTLLNGKNPIVEISDGVYFATSEPVVSGTKKTVNVKKTREIVISDLIPVGAAEILAAATGSDPTVGEKKTAWDDAKAALVSAQETFYTPADIEGGTSESGTLVTALSAASTYKTAVDAISASGTGDTELAAAKSAAAAAVAAINAAISSVTAEKVEAAHDALDALSTAHGTLTAVSGGPAGSLSACTVTSITFSSLTTAEEAVTTAKSEYDDAVAAAADSVSGVSKNQQNDIYDKAGEITSSFTKGLLASAYTEASLGFDITTDYASTGSSNSDHSCSDTAVSLYDAMVLIDKFTLDVQSGTRVGDWVDIADLDNTNEIVAPDGTKAPSNPAWKLLYNYLKYALADEFDASATTTYTKSQVEKLLSDSYQLATDTIETSMFATSNGTLVDARTDAAEWVKIANNNRRTYKDNVSTYIVGGISYDSTKIYNLLNDAYKQLKAEYDGFAYSYGDVINKISDAAKLVDGNTLSADASKKVAAAMNDVALAMTRVEALVDTSSETFEESTPFNDDGSINIYNRIMTVNNVKVATANGTKTMADSKDLGKPNHSHWVLKTAIEALDAAVEEATKVPETQITTDVDGNGKFELADVTTMLNLFANGKGEVAKHDFNGDGKVSLEDVTNLLNQFVNKT